MRILALVAVLALACSPANDPGGFTCSIDTLMSAPPPNQQFRQVVGLLLPSAPWTARYVKTGGTCTNYYEPQRSMACATTSPDTPAVSVTSDRCSATVSFGCFDGYLFTSWWTASLTQQSANEVTGTASVRRTDNVGGVWVDCQDAWSVTITR